MPDIQKTIWECGNCHNQLELEYKPSQCSECDSMFGFTKVNAIISETRTEINETPATEESLKKAPSAPQQRILWDLLNKD